MNFQQIYTWVKYHKAAFPSVGIQIDRHPETVATWAGVLVDITFEEAKAVTDDMQSGQLMAPHNLEWDRLPAIVAAEVTARRRFANRDPQTETYIDTPGPIYECARCRDTGLASVWSFHSVRVVLGAPDRETGLKIIGTIDDKWNRRGMTCPCDCYHGEQHIKTDFRNDEERRRWKGWTSDDFRFHPKLYAELDAAGNLDSAESRANLFDFVERLKHGETRHRYNGQLGCHERVSVFDEHNKGI